MLMAKDNCSKKKKQNYLGFSHISYISKVRLYQTINKSYNIFYCTFSFVILYFVLKYVYIIIFY